LLGREAGEGLRILALIDECSSLWRSCPMDALSAGIPALDLRWRGKGHRMNLVLLFLRAGPASDVLPADVDELLSVYIERYVRIYVYIYIYIYIYIFMKTPLI